MKKAYLNAVTCPLLPRLVPLSYPLPLQGHGEDGGLHVDEISRVRRLCPPHPLQGSVTSEGPPPPTTPSCGEACEHSEN
jgi:hypothetical protein